MDRTEALSRLLGETGRAHGTYEETELHGVYDQQWPEWYARYAVDHGIGELVGRALTADELARFLSSSNAEFERIEPKPSETWADYTARRIAAEL